MDTHLAPIYVLYLYIRFLCYFDDDKKVLHDLFHASQLQLEGRDTVSVREIGPDDNKNNKLKKKKKKEHEQTQDNK